MSDRSTVARHRTLGVLFVVLLLVLCWLTWAVFTTRLVGYVPVEVRGSRVGMQLPQRADVKIRGVVVGDVRSVESEGDGATLHLALDPDRVAIIPANVSVRILPKTLFGREVRRPSRSPTSRPTAASRRAT